MIKTLSSAIITITAHEKPYGNKAKHSTAGESIFRISQSVINNVKDTTGTLIKPTPKSEELSMMNILSALVLVVFFENVCSNKPLEITITKAVNG